MRKFYYSMDFYAYAPEKGDILKDDHAYVCPKCEKETSSNVIDIWAIDIDLLKFKTECFECGFILERQFDLPEGFSAYEFLGQSTDPTKSILFDNDEPYDEYEEFDKAMDDNDPNKLAHLVLQKFSPELCESMINISDEDMVKMVYNYFAIWVKDKINSLSLSILEKQKILNNQEQLFNFLAKNVKELPAVTFNLLSFNYVPKQLHLDISFISNLWVMSSIYSKGNDNDPYDQIAIINIFKYIIKLYDLLNIREINLTFPKFKELKYLSLNKLAETFFFLKKYSESILYYKECVKYAVENNVCNDNIIERKTNDIVTVLSEYNKELAIEFIIKILTDDYSEFGLTNYNLDYDFRGELEISLIPLYLETENNIEDLTDNGTFQTEIGIKSLKILWEAKQNQNLSDKNIEDLRILGIEMDENIFQKLNLRVDEEQRCKDLLYKLNLFNGGYEDLKPFVLELNILQKNVSNKKNKILILLYNAKLLYLNNDMRSFQCYQDVTTSLTLLDDTTQQIDWLCEKLNAVSLVIKNNPSLILPQIEKDIELVIKIIIESIKTAKDNFFTVKELVQGEFEKVFFAVLSIIQSLEENEVIYLGDAKPTKSELGNYNAIEYLLQLLWNIIILKIKTLDSFYIFNNQSEKYQELLIEYNNFLVEYHCGKLSIQNINQLSNELNKLSISEYSSDKLTQNEFPINKTILYLPITKKNNERLILVISYNPNGHDKKNNLKFDYSIIEEFEDFEEIIKQIKNKVSYQFKGMQFEADKAKILTEKLVNPFNNYDSNLMYKLKLLGISDAPLNISIYRDGIMQDIPFEYLNNHENTPLGIKFAINYIAKNEIGFNKIEFNKPALIISEINTWGQFDKIDTREERIAIETILSKNNMKVVSLIGKNANSQKFKTSVITIDPEIIHFSSHGLFDKNLPYDSDGIMLSNSEILSFRDILGLNLNNVNLVVLSTCQSSVMVEKNGKAIQGLAHAFLLAGAKNVLGSKVKIDNSQTIIFMNKFYEYLLDNTVSETLRLTREYFHTTNYRDFSNLYSYENNDKRMNEYKKFVSDWILWS